MSTIRRLASLLLVVTLLSPAVTAPAAAAGPPLERLVGQKLMVAMSGTTPTSSLLGRIQRGELGGVILFGHNITTAAAVRSLSAKLQAAAKAGGQPPLLIATDQEGGSVKRIPWAPPTLSPPRMGEHDDASEAAAQGKATGIVLRCAGINDDLAPVADVPASADSFIERQGRAWSRSAAVTARLASAFAVGLVAGGDVPAMKHFPGLGYATKNTDTTAVTITASAAALDPGLAPYRTAIANHVPMVMLSNATYTAWDSANAAGWSHAISVDLLRGRLGFTGVTITDSLTGTAASRHVSPTSLAVKAARAGTDMLLLSGSEAATAASYTALLDAARSGSIPRATLESSYARIVALKGTIHGPVADAAAPTVAAPRDGLYAPSTLGSTSVPVRTAWSATDPCGVSGYALHRSLDGGPYATQSLASPTSTSVVRSLAIGGRERYRVKATDGAGNTGAWTYGATTQAFLRESSSSYVVTTGSWGSVAGSGYSGGSTRYASAAGASASYTFTGTSVGWVAATGPTRGAAKVYLDGAYVRTVDLHASTTSLRRIVFAANWATRASHTIRIVVVGTTGHPRVDVDAFVRLYR
jgi:beta-N-acetylhexosaminidase